MHQAAFLRLIRMRAALIKSLFMTQCRTRQMRRTHAGSGPRPAPKHAIYEKSRSMPVRRPYRSRPKGLTAAGTSSIAIARRRCGET